MLLKRLMQTLVCMILLMATSSGYPAPAPPDQLLFGPGGSDYLHQAVQENGPYYAIGPGRKDNYKFYVYEPADPMPAQAPVILFLHGWLAYEPRQYQGWIDHIVKNGYIVVWAQYDAGLTLPGAFAQKALTTWRQALQLIELAGQVSSHVAPEKIGDTIRTGIVGHSAGGYLSAILASLAVDPQYGIPIPEAVLAVEPGGLGIIPEPDFQQIPAETKFLAVVGDEDNIVCISTAVSMWNGLSHLPDTNRDFLLVLSDRHGFPRQIADHKFPATDGLRADIDARDFYITYKLSVALFECAFRGAYCDYALGDGTANQVDMGLWSDGVPMEPLMWVEEPNLLETNCSD